MSSPTISETSDDVNTEKTPHASTFPDNNLDEIDFGAGSDDDEGTRNSQEYHPCE
jgi:hypothetical protein